MLSKVWCFLVWKFRCYFRCENFGVFFWCCEISLVLKFQRELAWAFSIEKHQKNTKNNIKIHKKTPKINTKFFNTKKNFNTKKIFTTPKKTPNLVLTPKCSEKTTRIYHLKKTYQFITPLRAYAWQNIWTRKLIYCE